VFDLDPMTNQASMAVACGWQFVQPALEERIRINFQSRRVDPAIHA
jgi:hypothetical protein